MADSQRKEQAREEWERMTPRQRLLRKRETAAAEIEDPAFNSAIVKRAQKRMARVDAMEPEMRAVVYDYNLEVVWEFINHGVKTPSSVRHLIDTVLGADFKNGQPRFKLNKSPNAKRNPAADDDEYWTA